MSEEDDNEENLKEKLKSSRLTKSKEEFLEVLYNLTDQELEILRTRFGIDLDTNHNTEAVGEQFDVTRKRIREIEKKALAKLRKLGPGDDDPESA